jgi:hypothetical protein
MRIWMLLATCILSMPEAQASVDHTPPPGGVYHLKPGTYVRVGVGCAAPPREAIRRYDRRGISRSEETACRARVLSRRGGRYEVEQSCTVARSRHPLRRSEFQTVTVVDALTFVLDNGRRDLTYRYCPASMLRGVRGDLP